MDAACARHHLDTFAGWCERDIRQGGAVDFNAGAGAVADAVQQRNAVGVGDRMLRAGVEGDAGQRLIAGAELPHTIIIAKGAQGHRAAAA